MTDVNPSTSPTTALADFLASEYPQAETGVYRGAVTPTQLDALPGEIAALGYGTAIHDLGWLQRVTVRGKDRFRWLSGMVTNMVKDLAPGSGAWNMVLTSQGRIQGDLTVWRDGDNLELEIDADQVDRLLAHLDHFIVMDDVELVRLEDETAVGLTGPKAAELLSRLGLPVLEEPLTQARTDWHGTPLLIRRGYGVLAAHYALWTAPAQAGTLWRALAEAGAKPVGSAALEAFRIAEGIPAYGIDIVERDLPQETSQLRGIHFDKGCYLGQEIVERIRSRGNVHRYLRALELEGPVPEPGTKLTLDGAEMGHLTSAADLPLSGGSRVFALGMVRGEAEARNLLLAYTHGETMGTARISIAAPKL